MNNQTYILTASDGKKLFAQSWSPDVDSKKLIIFIHGMGEHSSRYNSWASMFAEKGYTFLSMDLRGHGKSEGRKGHADSIIQLINDIDLLFKKADELFPGYRRILYGHSMGGTLALNHVIIKNPPLEALIVTSPWLKLASEPSSMMLSVARFVRIFMPSLAISNRLKAEQMSHDPEVIQAYTSDPLMHDRITLKMFDVIYNAGYHALRNIYKINCPFLVMHGKADTVTSSKSSEDFVRNTSKRTRLKLWEKQYHELHNELIRIDVFNYITSWLSEYKL